VSDIKDVIASLRKNFPDDDGSEVALGEEAATLIEEYNEWQRMETEAVTQKEECMARLMLLLGTHKAGKVNGWLVTWQTVARKAYPVPATKLRRFSVKFIGL
jgi:hypothetical protein